MEEEFKCTAESCTEEYSNAFSSHKAQEKIYFCKAQFADLQPLHWKNCNNNISLPYSCIVNVNNYKILQELLGEHLKC